MRIKFASGDKLPIPEAGDRIENGITISGTLESCDCSCEPIKWPSKGWEKGFCGPHCRTIYGIKVFFKSFQEKPGWLYGGVLIRDEDPVYNSAAPEADLKIMNSDGRTECAACGGRIAEPWPGIRHCPACEA